MELSFYFHRSRVPLTNVTTYACISPYSTEFRVSDSFVMGFDLVWGAERTEDVKALAEIVARKQRAE